MPSRTWFAAIAFGLAFSFEASAQEVTLEQPIESRIAQQQPNDQPAVEPKAGVPSILSTQPTGTEHDRSAAKDTSGGSGDHLYWGDGVAQWVMALTGVAALLLSAWAVWLLKKTLDASEQTLKEAAETTRIAKRSFITTRASMKLQLREARESAVAVQDANRIMRDEQRPWITLAPRFPNGVRIVDGGLCIDIAPVFENIGARPAYDVWVEAKAVLPGTGLEGNPTTQFLVFCTNVQNRRLTQVGPNGRIVFPNQPGGGMNFAQRLQGQDLNGLDLTNPETVLLPHIFICCNYRAEMSGPLRVSAQSYMLTRIDNGSTKIITVESCDVPEGGVIADTSFQPSDVT